MSPSAPSPSTPSPSAPPGAPAAQSPSPAGSGHAPRPARSAVVLALALAAAVTVVCIAFAWPAVRSGLNEVPVGLVAPASSAGQVTQGLEAARPGAFDITAFADEAELVEAVREREVYGGFVLSPTGITVVSASAASPLVAQSLEQAGTALAQGLQAEVTVDDVVPAPPEDPRQAGLAASALPLTLAGLLPAYAFAFLYRGRVLLGVTAALGTAVLTGFAVAAVLRFWFGSVEQAYPTVALGLALAAAATSAVLLGLNAVGGIRAMGLGVATFLLLGNPLSGLSSAPELLPAGWGALGQLLPAGAGATLLRSNAFFDGAGAGRPLLVLVLWLAVGLALAAAGAATAGRARRLQGVSGQ